MRTHLAPRTGRFEFYLTTLVCIFVLALGLACSGGGGDHAEEAEPEEAATEATAETAESAGAPRIWFVTPKDGDTVSSPVKFEFASENIVIEPKGDVHAGAGHHHLGVNTECLPPGTRIPDADPWVHFGDGSNTMEMQLPPGEYTFTIQVGDGEHVTLDEPGLCTTISVTVVE